MEFSATETAPTTSNSYQHFRTEHKTKGRMEFPVTEMAPTLSKSYRTSLKVFAIFGAFVVVFGLVHMPTTPLTTGLAYSNDEQGHVESSDDSSIPITSSRTIDQNDPIHLERKNTPIKVACVGDSITFQGCVTDKNDTYVSQLSWLLGSDYEVTNYGHSGRTLLKNGFCGHENQKNPCSYWNTTEFQAAIDSSPDIITIMLGTNDAKRCNWYGSPNGYPSGGGSIYFSDYIDLINVFWSLPSAPKIYLALPPPLVHPPNHPEEPVPFDMDDHVVNDQMRLLIPSIAKEFTSRFNTPIGVIDVWSALGGTKGYFDPSMSCDGCHPEKAAHAIIAKTIASAIGNDFSSRITEQKKN